MRGPRCKTQQRSGRLGSTRTTFGRRRIFFSRKISARACSQDASTLKVRAFYRWCVSAGTPRSRTLTIPIDSWTPHHSKQHNCFQIAGNCLVSLVAPGPLTGQGRIFAKRCARAMSSVAPAHTLRDPNFEFACVFPEQRTFRPSPTSPRCCIERVTSGTRSISHGSAEHLHHGVGVHASKV